MKANEAPEKIYLFPDDNDEFWYKPEEFKTLPPKRVEYIRKDALLEWVEKMEQSALKDIADGKPVKGSLTTWRRIAVKIESM